MFLIFSQLVFFSSIFPFKSFFPRYWFLLNNSSWILVPGLPITPWPPCTWGICILTLLRPSCLRNFPLRVRYFPSEYVVTWSPEDPWDMPMSTSNSLQMVSSTSSSYDASSSHYLSLWLSHMGRWISTSWMNMSENGAFLTESQLISSCKIGIPIPHPSELNGMTTY